MASLALPRCESSTNLEIEIEKKKKKKKKGKNDHKESPSSSLGEPFRTGKNDDDHFAEEEEEIERQSRNDETKRKKTMKKNGIDHKKSTSSSYQETFKRAKNELLDDDVTEMKSSNDFEKKMRKKVIEGVEVDEELESIGDKVSVDNNNKKKKIKKANGSANDTSGSESNRSVNLEEKRRKKKKKKKKGDIEAAEFNEKTKGARDSESIDNEELKNSGSRKLKTEGSINDTSGSESNESVNLEETQIEMGNGERKKMKRKKKKDTDKVEVNEETKGKNSFDSKKRKRTEGTINDAGESENKKSKKRDNANNGDQDKVDKKASNLEKKKSAVKSKKREKEKSRRVRFSGNIEVFPSSDNSDVEVYDEGSLVRGKRFSPAEDKLIRETVQNYIDMNQLGEEGLEMVMYSSKYPQARGCWNEICAAIPWRPYDAVYGRARTILRRSDKRGFSEEEKEMILKFHAKHGPKWLELANILGRPRQHVKDGWRQIRLQNAKEGKWSEDEYQALFDLVNLDLRIKSFEERKSTNVMFRENIAWEAISEKLSTRKMSICCRKWYDQLTSPLVRQGEWADTDDYRLIHVLQKQDACDVEDVDWDHLLEERPGEICRRRWHEMVRHIGGNQERSFIEQVDVLSKRYCMDMLQYRKSKEKAMGEGGE